MLFFFYKINIMKNKILIIISLIFTIFISDSNIVFADTITEYTNKDTIGNIQLKLPERKLYTVNNTLSDIEKEKILTEIKKENPILDFDKYQIDNSGNLVADNRIISPSTDLITDKFVYPPKITVYSDKLNQEQINQITNRIKELNLIADNILVEPSGTVKINSGNSEQILASNMFVNKIENVSQEEIKSNLNQNNSSNETNIKSGISNNSNNRRIINNKNNDQNKQTNTQSKNKAKDSKSNTKQGIISKQPKKDIEYSKIISKSKSNKLKHSNLADIKFRKKTIKHKKKCQYPKLRKFILTYISVIICLIVIFGSLAAKIFINKKFNKKRLN